MKDRIRRWIFNIIGYPTDVQNLLNYIDTFEGDICIYPNGDFNLGVKTITGEDTSMSFPTPQERSAFGSGLSYGIHTMGGTANFLSQQELEEFEEMEDIASIKSDPSKVS